MTHPVEQKAGESGELERVRHLKTGGVYEVLGEAEVQIANPVATSNKGQSYSYLREGNRLTVYRADDGKLWARFTDEFRDGRFVSLSPSGAVPVGGEGTGAVLTDTGSREPSPSASALAGFDPSRAELDRLSEAASQGEWTVERMKNEGTSPADKFFSYGIECGPHTILDTLNSSGGVLEQEHDGEGTTVWDEQARRDLTYVATLVNAHRAGKLVSGPAVELDIAGKAE